MSDQRWFTLNHVNTRASCIPTPGITTSLDKKSVSQTWRTWVPEAEPDEKTLPSAHARYDWGFRRRCVQQEANRKGLPCILMFYVEEAYNTHTIRTHYRTRMWVRAHTHTRKYIQSIMHIKAITVLSVRRHIQTHTRTHASCAGVPGPCSYKNLMGAAKYLLKCTPMCLDWGTIALATEETGQGVGKIPPSGSAANPISHSMTASRPTGWPPLKLKSAAIL